MLSETVWTAKPAQRICWRIERKRREQEKKMMLRQDLQLQPNLPEEINSSAMGDYLFRKKNRKKAFACNTAYCEVAVLRTTAPLMTTTHHAPIKTYNDNMCTNEDFICIDR